MAGTLQYLNITRLDIAYVVQQLCLHMHSPCDCHSALLKRVIHYIKGTTPFIVKLHASALPSIPTYSDIDWEGTRHLAFVCSSGMLSFPGHWSDNQQSPGQVWRSSIVGSPMSVCTIFLVNFTSMSPRWPSHIMIMFLPSTCPKTMCITDGPSILYCRSILLGIKLL